MVKFIMFWLPKERIIVTNKLSPKAPSHAPNLTIRSNINGSLIIALP